MIQVRATLLNVEQMPNRDPKVTNGLRSVTDGKVTWGRPRLGGLETVVCVKHGAMLRVGEKLWRCPTCNEGAYTPDGIRHGPDSGPDEWVRDAYGVVIRCEGCGAPATPDPEDGCCIVFAHSPECPPPPVRRYRPRRKRKPRSPHESETNPAATLEDE